MRTLRVKSFCWELWVLGHFRKAFRDKGQAKKAALKTGAAYDLRRTRRSEYHVGAHDRQK